MAGPRQPIELVIANDRKHLTKAEIEERRSRELKPCTDEIQAPSYLTAKEKKDFYKIAEQLKKLNIMGETDCDTLARYIVAEGFFREATKELRKAIKERPQSDDYELDEKKKYYDEMDMYYARLDSATKRQERYFKQAQTAAAALGLTISSRCRLVAPVQEEKPKENKFSKFGKAAGGK